MSTVRKSNPFRAGFGVDPPYFAGRHKEIAVIKEALDKIKDGSGQMAYSPSSALVISGPRGVGKTVLLGHAISAAGKRGIHMAEVKSRLLSGPPRELVDHVFPAGALKEIFGNLKRISINFMDAGLAIDLGKAENDFESAVKAFLSRKPLLLVMDEAHTCKPEALNLLFDVVQTCIRAKMPLALIIAGTPGLEPLISRCDASYVERSKFLKFNTLSKDEARAALEKPATDGGRPMDSDALELLLDWSDNHPYFLQLSGSLAWEASVKSGEERITIENAREGLSEADQERVGLYDKRLTELCYRGLDEYAVQSIRIIRERTSERTSQRFLANRLVGMNEGMDRKSASRIVEDLMEVGFLWKDKTRIHPGIPSMFDYVERELEMDSS